ncbi:MAG TPA: hypothetical protein DEH07_02255 [Desulfotomaculum sp.]|nr:MAG: hypothetical protein XD84_1003 [Desulfotomaculum sp. 46_80]KUK85413.1 MAG: hypothetical protein XE00_0125 [Desulfofundulus kuznetsovii]HBY03366.1 hypothetical protein [Desulfotomaculum sp.]
MNFYETFSYLRGEGIKTLPVPGTNKYFISFRDGESIYIKEKILIGLVKSAIEDPGSIIPALKSLQAPHA